MRDDGGRTLWWVLALLLSLWLLAVWFLLYGGRLP